jgi:glycosyltransferase involved in cell wall biosynthesis
MNVIIGCEAANEYADQLARSLSQHRKIDSAEDSLIKFWRQPSNMDVVHIQWPEALFDWSSPSPWELAWLEDRLDRWSSAAVIITTVHNYESHTLDGCEELYEMVYEKSDGFVHLGEASRRFFFDQYPFAPGKHHAIIPHGNYTCFPNHVTSDDARNRLGLGQDDVVCLCFGSVRHPEERDLLIEAFDQFEARRKKLLIAGRLPPPPRHTLLYWRIKCDPRLLIQSGWIPDEDVQLYFNAADIVVIPRKGKLNSGNVALGFTFGCAVVGPNEGVIGEVLRKTGNPVYEPGNPLALSEALEEAVGIKSKLGERNRRYALDCMRWENVASDHADLYGTVLD